MIRLILFSVLILSVFSCSSFTEKTPTVDDISGKTWVLTYIGSLVASKEVKTTIEFSQDNQISGNAGCNSYFGSYELVDGSFTVSAIGSTKKMCPENIMTQEDNFLITLDGAISAKMFGDNLVIYSDEIFQKLKFTSH
ncbi:MAG: META domain-containing protein [Thermodesulfobacteriota bacterium]